ncbi:MAG: methyltransferase domain-containing protein, partial [Acidimicrobiales bacterium]
PVADLGCGPGGYAPALGSAGHAVVGVDAARAMLDLAGPSERRLQADLEALPLATGSLGAAWARHAYLHVPPDRLPLALAQVHRALAVGAPAALSFVDGPDFVADDELPGRVFFGWHAGDLDDVLAGAGFVDVRVEAGGGTLWATARRGRTLPDVVGPGMRLLVCGLNPSLVAADAGVGFASPTNRFWRAAVAAGAVSRPRDPWRALLHDGVGMTDLVKRATPRASELDPAEYAAGAARVARVVERLRPRAVCFVGLAGWRAAVDRRAVAGWQPAGFAGAPAYVMPSSSGLNARATPDELARHLRAALAPPPG